MVALGGSTVGSTTINAAGYLEVVFRSSNGFLVDHTTIDGDELELRDAAGTLLTLGSPLRVGTSDTYRFSFTGSLVAGRYEVTFLAGSFSDTGGSTNQAELENFTVQTPSGALTGPEHGQVVDREAFQDGTTGDITIDVEYTPTSGASVDITTLGSNDLTLSGAGLQNLTFVSVTQLTPTSFRYRFTGSPITTGKVTVSFNQDGWRDTAGNQSGAAQRQFAVITQAASFFIELSGGILLQSAGIFDEPLLEAKATVILEIDAARRVFTLSFTGELKIIKLGTVGATAGRFVLDMSGTASTSPQFWGVATIDTNFQALEQYGLFLLANGTLQVNLTGTQKIETIELPGFGSRTYTLKANSFSLELVGQVRVRPPGSTTDLVRMQGGFFLSIDPTKFEMYATASLSFGIGESQLTYGEATGLFVIVTGADGRNPGVAGMLTVGSSVGLGLPSVGSLFSASGSVTIMFNTTRQDQVFTIPPAFLPLLDPGDPTTIEIWGSAPRLDGTRNPSAPASGEVYIKAIVNAQLSIGGITLTGFISITIAVGGGAGMFEIVGAVGTQIQYIGALSGQLYLRVQIGAGGGIVGRVSLSMGAGNGNIPGVSLSGQFLLEINTFSTAQEIQTFKTKTRTLGTKTLFDGFERDGAGNLVVTTQTIDIVGGFRLVLAGALTLGPLTITAEMKFTLQLGGSNPFIELLVNGELSLSPLGGMRIVDSGFRVNSQGLVARANVSLDASFGSNVGITFSASALLSINTTGVAQTLGGSTVAAGFRLRVDGSIFITGFTSIATISGFLDIAISTGSLQVSAGLQIALGPLNFGVSGSLGIFTNGITLDLAVNFNLNLLGIFGLELNGRLKLDTRPASRIFELQLSGKLSLFGVLNLTGGLKIVVSPTKWSISIPSTTPLSASLAGLLTLSAYGTIESTGLVDITVTGGIKLGDDSIGSLSGTATVRVSLNPTTKVFFASIGGSVSAKILGVELFGVSATGSITATLGPTSTTAVLRVTVQGTGLFFEVVEKIVRMLKSAAEAIGAAIVGFFEGVGCAIASLWGGCDDQWVDAKVTKTEEVERLTSFTLDVATFTLPAFPFASATPPAPNLATVLSGGVLRLNVGDAAEGGSAAARNVDPGNITEQYDLVHIGGSALGETIRVTAFGKTETFQNVTSIRAFFGSGNDTLLVNTGILVPIEVHGGSGNDTLTYNGSNSAKLYGDAGNDVLTTGTAVTGDPTTVVFDGGSGNDTLRHNSSARATMSGGTDHDTIFGGTGADVISGDAGNDTIQTGGGADAVDGGANDDVLRITLGSIVTGTTYNGGSGTDKIEINGGSGIDSFGARGNLVGELMAGAFTRSITLTGGVEDIVWNGSGGNDAFLLDGILTGILRVTIDPGTGTDDLRVNLSSANDTARLATTPTQTFLTWVGRYVLTVNGTTSAQGDRLTIDAGDGHDVLTALGVEYAIWNRITLIGGTGNDTVFGGIGDDTIDSGLGNDTVSGGGGTDTFIDAGGTDQLIEGFDLDFGVYGNLLVIGTAAARTGSGETLAVPSFSSATVENISVFETLRPARPGAVDRGRTSSPSVPRPARSWSTAWRAPASAPRRR